MIVAVYVVLAASADAGVTDLAGNAVGAGQSWAITTGANADSTAPGVLSTIPANIASDVAISSAIKVIFNEPMDPATITTANFLVTTPDLTAVIGTVAFDATTNTATFTRINHTVTPVISHTTPVSELEPDTTYTATVTTGMKDMAGNPLVSD